MSAPTRNQMFRLKYRNQSLLHCVPKAVCVNKKKFLIADNPSNWIEKHFVIEPVNY